jgi:RNA polymerase sigma factor (sigma-70 family)
MSSEQLDAAGGRPEQYEPPPPSTPMFPSPGSISQVPEAPSSEPARQNDPLLDAVAEPLVAPNSVSEFSLEELIQSCIAGNRASWARLYELYDGRLELWARRFRLPADDAEDMRQDCWVYLFAREAQVLARYTPKDGATFDGWLYVVHARFCVPWLQRRIHQRDLLHGDPLEALDRQGPLSFRDPIHRIELIRYLRVLSPLEQRIVTLYCHGYGHDEIGARCGISPENSAVILSRCRSRLRRLRDGDM